ncbi:citrate lyase subunit alpha / citrate CoA-transferase [Roseovarius azorensis]|uniref:Citrate lyase alpha chain n=1 Tax=Roseovarius azorensis TaxID=1287727 RepID=A0A1H7XML2_9RHOB|nr:citrate lyase subunit alpha [Roseovarius azorensis]SEM34991.1 citrate lyase subunit alpha / citrate CoA-transferase [Roseovarius azorensis]
MTDHLRVPDFVEGFGPLQETRVSSVSKSHGQHRKPVLPDLDAAISALELKDGAVLSFHHHLRNGDAVMVAVLEAAARAGLRDLHVAASSIFAVHAPLVKHIESGVIGSICTNFMSGPVAEAISRGLMTSPVLLRTHGGRARAIRSGELEIDVAFVAAPSCDPMGNISGTTGPQACGVLGYPQCDVLCAKRVVAVTDTLVDYPAQRIQISQDSVDMVALVRSLGDVSGILSGTTRPSEQPDDLEIASKAARVIEASGLLVNGFSLQNGAGGTSLATAAALGRVMERKGIVGSFASGGVTGFHVDMLEAGLFESLLNVQCFDLKAIESFRNDPRHQGMSASMYANPHERGAVVDRLDAVVLGAAEIDLEFNVNVTTRADGLIMGGSGGHADTAAGATLSIVTTKLTAAGFPKIVDRVGTLTTPGKTIDVVVTNAGIAVNPGRDDLTDRLRAAGLTPVPIEELHRLALEQSERRPQRSMSDHIVAISEYRDGTVTDVIRKV